MPKPPRSKPKKAKAILSSPWPPLSVRRAAVVLKDFGPYAYPEALSAAAASVASSADDLFGNGSAGLRSAERIAAVAFEAMVRALGAE